MPRTFRHVQRAVIAAPREAIWRWIGEPERYPEIHPLVREVTVLERGGDDRESFVRFEVVDDLPLFGLFELPFTYRAHLTRYPKEDRMVIVARSAPQLVSTSHWSLSEVSQGTCLRESVELCAPWPIAGFAFRQSRRSHAAMMVRLEQLLSTGSPIPRPVG